MNLKSFLFSFSFFIFVSSSLYADRYSCGEVIVGIYAELHDMEMTEVWSRYKATNSSIEKTKIRNFLIEKYYHLVKNIAEAIFTRLPNEVDIEDLVGAGIFGLLDAIDGFNLDRGFKFETYSAPRIKGAILDHLREMDWVPRLVRHRSAKIINVKEDFRKRNGRSPSENELLELLVAGVNGQAESELNAQKIIKDGAQVTSRFSIDQLRRSSKDGSQEFREIDTIADQKSIHLMAVLQRKYLFESLTKSFSRAERLIIFLYYYQGLSMKEVAFTLGLSESRVSQMHTSILRRLAAQLTESTISQLEEASGRSP